MDRLNTQSVGEGVREALSDAFVSIGLSGSNTLAGLAVLISLALGLWSTAKLFLF
ncbi:hypothetical protein [Agarilytica rhodophyticola]|uniref:hypothetical protein n=1 Tax=Agarilytica rhodophyticola TaxID=1737490 RepID=UPI0013153996|nr:hypothetical protein [Agarilytica rhodophyticola]